MLDEEDVSSFTSLLLKPSSVFSSLGTNLVLLTGWICFFCGDLAVFLTDTGCSINGTASFRTGDSCLISSMTGSSFLALADRLGVFLFALVTGVFWPLVNVLELPLRDSDSRVVRGLIGESAGSSLTKTVA